MSISPSNGVTRMAGDWIKMRTNLDTDPRVLKMAHILSVADVDCVVGKLWKLWANADDHTTHGLIPLATPEIIVRIVALPGFGAALAQVGWLEFTEAGAQVVRFDEHNGASAKNRALTAQRMRASRDDCLNGASQKPNKSAQKPNKRAPRRDIRGDIRGDKDPPSFKKKEGGGPGEGNEACLPLTDPLSPAALADLWCFHHRGTCASQRNVFNVTREFEEWLGKCGVKPEALRAAILEPNRDCSEPLWKLKERLLPPPAKGVANGQRNGSTPSYRFDPVRDAGKSG